MNQRIEILEYQIEELTKSIDHLTKEIYKPIRTDYQNEFNTIKKTIADYYKEPIEVFERKTAKTHIVDYRKMLIYISYLLGFKQVYIAKYMNMSKIYINRVIMRINTKTKTTDKFYSDIENIKEILN